MTCNYSSLLRALFFAFFLIFSLAVCGQENQDEAAREAQKYVREAEEAVNDGDFHTAEAYYREAIAKDPSNATARYNMGNLYYNEEVPKDAVERHSQAAEMAREKTMKHRSFHNQGNAYMKQKKYSEAIEAYKNALRNNPKDDETRYNLALAKKLLEEEKEGGGGDDSEDQEGEDEDQDSENQDEEEGEGEKDNSEEGEQQDEEGGDKENKDEQGKGEDDDQGEPESDQQKDQEGNRSEEEGQLQQQPKPGQLSPQQIQNLLEAMGNEEKKVQEKINAEKAKGAKTKSDKDW